ncbi:MAG TPA: hypothetical protein VMV49_10140 [Candidatus Deferrimicrobium sp.]|nr:hypothetical protein [Candidatus Deferrimicrobium sp.]
MKKDRTMIIFFTLLISLSTVFMTLQLVPSPKQIQKGTTNEDLSASAWALNGVPFVNETDHQAYPQLCEDGEGGAIIVWSDYRGDDIDIYVQRINLNGERLWANEGIPICTAYGLQDEPQIASDGVNGAIIVWRDQRSGVTGWYWDIYAQRINSSGHTLWTPNGTVICNASDGQKNPQIVCDDDEGAIIVWADYRSTNWDIYAQRIDSNGSVHWGPNGTSICITSNTQDKPQLCSDGNGGAMITWEQASNVYAQHINSSGVVQWEINGKALCASTVYEPKIVSDGSGGAIVVWIDCRVYFDLYGQRIDSKGIINWSANGKPILINEEFILPLALRMISDLAGGAILTWTQSGPTSQDVYGQRINLNGDVLWIPTGVPICTLPKEESSPKIAGDGHGGAFISWVDIRNDPTGDVYAQYINSIGQLQWTANGVPICTAGGNQDEIQLLAVGDDSVILIWQDSRGANDDLYAGYIKNVPTSNHPDNVVTTAQGSETITWVITDDAPGGSYRVWATDPSAVLYLLVDWTPWKNNTIFHVALNRTAPGTFEYTLEYYDNATFILGNPDSVTVTIQDLPPTSNQPANITTTTLDSGTIIWILYDDFGTGQFRVWVNDTNNLYHVWYGWAPWTNNSPIYIPINRIATGIFNYTIEFNSSDGQMVYDTILITVTAGTSGTILPTNYKILFLLMGALLVMTLVVTVVLYRRLSNKITKLKKSISIPKEPLSKQ